MLEVPCPQCSSNLYSKSALGFRCNACGYTEQTESQPLLNEVMENRGFTFDTTPEEVEAHWSKVKSEEEKARRASEMARQRAREWDRAYEAAGQRLNQSRQAYYEKQRVLKEHENRKRHLNKLYVQAKACLVTFDNSRDKGSLLLARRNIEECLKHQERAKNAILLVDLKAQIEKRLGK